MPKAAELLEVKASRILSEALRALDRGEAGKERAVKLLGQLRAMLGGDYDRSAFPLRPAVSLRQAHEALIDKGDLTEARRILRALQRAWANWRPGL